MFLVNKLCTRWPIYDFLTILGYKAFQCQGFAWGFVINKDNMSAFACTTCRTYYPFLIKK